MRIAALEGEETIAAALDKILGLKRYRDSDPNIPAEKESLERASRSFVQISQQLAAAKEDDLGLSPLEEVEVCRKLLQANTHHFDSIRPRVLDFVESRLVLRENRQMTMAEAIAFVADTVRLSATPNTNWEVLWKDAYEEAERTLSNATIQNLTPTWYTEELGIELVITMDAPNERGQ